MNNSKFQIAMLLAGCVPAMPAMAHHSAAQFDLAQEVLLTGKLTQYDYRNPHIYLTLEVTGADGELVAQDVEVAPVSVMQPLGLLRDSLQIGEQVTVRAHPNRRGANRIAFGRDVTRADGKVFPLSLASNSVRPASNALADGLDGVWRPANSEFDAMLAASISWPLTEAGRRQRQDAQQAHSTTQSECVAAGIPMLMLYPVAMGMQVAATTVTLDIDWFDTRRVIYLDAAAHTADVVPSLQGHSIGHWEDDVLVVDTVAFTPHAWGTGFGVPSSERKHVVERFSLAADKRHLDYEVTVEDPVFLQEPLQYSAQWEYSPDLTPSGLACDLELAQRYLRDAEQP